jgi:hypothetical protein
MKGVSYDYGYIHGYRAGQKDKAENKISQQIVKLEEFLGA